MIPSSSNRSKFTRDERAGFAESNAVRPQLRKEEEEELRLQMAQRNTRGTER